MASARKKQDEKNLKILRELVAQPGNKHCFDCNQRGPTYVNMTIGSFVCTKCSGMLRGLNPPHRVKSISMASFTTEEVELVKSRGNEYCRSTWLALWDQNPTTETKDEQEIKDFMIDKYERQRFFHDKGLRNGTLSPPNSHKSPEIKPPTNLVGSQTITIKSSFNRVNGDSAKLNNGTAVNNGTTDFVADFNSADIFSATNQFNNNNHQVMNGSTTQPSFANFDNNVIFNSATYQSSYDLLVSQLTQMPKYVTHRWHVTSPPTLNSPNNLSQSPMNKSAMPPSEDRYAALKDLDIALKTQQQQNQQHLQQQQQYQQDTHLEWNSGSNCNGSGYASPSQSSSSLYGSPSTAGSIYGSPSQGQFVTSFDLPNNVSNPFSSNSARSPWTPNGNSTVIANNFQTQFGANPFRADNSFNGVSKFSNGTINGFNGNSFNGNSVHGNGFNGNQQSFQHQQQPQQSMFTSSQNFGNSKPWTSPNPFALGVSPGNSATSSNPFL